MKFAEFLEHKDEIFFVEGIEVRIVEVPFLEVVSPYGVPPTYKKFRVTWTNPNGSSSTRYVLASNKYDALKMVREDLEKVIQDRRSTDPFAKLPAGNMISGHKGAAKVKDVSAVNNVDEIARMIRRTGLPNVDWWDVNIMLKALINGVINPQDTQLIKGAIETLKRKKPELFYTKGNDTNWSLLRRWNSKNQPTI